MTFYCIQSCDNSLCLVTSHLVYLYFIFIKAPAHNFYLYSTYYEFKLSEYQVSSMALVSAMHRLSGIYIREPSTTGFQIKNKQLVIRQSVTVLFSII
jgi:hypothetical protein